MSFKLFISKLAFACLILFLPLSGNSQCSIGPLNSWISGPSCATGEVLENYSIAGDQYCVNVIAGNTYTFSTCGNTDDDTQITLFEAGLTVAYNDDGCDSRRSLATYTATTAEVCFQVESYYCEGSGSDSYGYWVDIYCNCDFSMDPLSTDYFDQTAPFNSSTPLCDSERANVGCSAVAVSQIMRYYEFPNTNYSNIDLFYHVVCEDEETNESESISVNFVSLTDSKLLEINGKAINTTYGHGDLPSFADDTSILYWLQALGYSNAEYLKGANSSTIHNTLRNELDECRPVIVSARNNKGEGHMYIIDDYSPCLDRYHFNFGWGGKRNGYYKFSELAEAGSKNNYQFNMNLIHNLIPNGCTNACNCNYNFTDQKPEIELVEHRTVACPILNFPTTSSISNHTVYFDWTDVSGATSYNVIVNDANSSMVLYDEKSYGGYSFFRKEGEFFPPGTNIEIFIEPLNEKDEVIMSCSPFTFSTSSMNCTTAFTFLNAECIDTGTEYVIEVEFNGLNVIHDLYAGWDGIIYDSKNDVLPGSYLLGPFDIDQPVAIIVEDAANPYNCFQVEPVFPASLEINNCIPNPINNLSCETPTSISYTVNTNNVTFNWAVVDNANTYELCYGTNGVTDDNCITTSNTSASVSLPDCDDYFYRVRAICNSGPSIFTTYNSFSLPEINPTCNFPNNISITENSSSLQVTWSSPVGASPENYILRYKLAQYSIWTEITLNSSATNYTISGLNSCTNYNVQMKTLCECDDSNWSSVSVHSTTGCIGSTCDNGVMDGNETGVDCGGDCVACYTPPTYTCSDNVQNGFETGIDCGGPDCAPCPSCTDGIQNQGETDIDCGGPCPSCPTPCNDNITWVFSCYNVITGYYSIDIQLPNGPQFTVSDNYGFYQTNVYGYTSLYYNHPETPTIEIVDPANPGCTEIINITPADIAPCAPCNIQNVSLIPLNSSTVEVSWDFDPYFNVVQVYLFPDCDNGDPDVINVNVFAPQTSVIINDVQSCVNYCYNVTPLCDNGFGPNYSNTLFIDSDCNPCAPEYFYIPGDITIGCHQNAFSLGVTGQASTNCTTCSNPTSQIVNNQLNGCNGTGTVQRIWSYTDECGDSYSETQTITVQDVEGPDFTLPADITIDCDDNFYNVALTGNVSNIQDNGCGATSTSASYNLSNLTGCFNSGYVIKTWTVEDNCGNVTTKNQYIVVEEPNIIIPNDVTLNCDQNYLDLGITGGVPYLNPNSCGAYSYTYTHDVSNLDYCTNAGLIFRSWEIDDNCGSISSYVQIIEMVSNDCETVRCEGESCYSAEELTTNGSYACDGPNFGNSATQTNADHSDWFYFVAPSDGLVTIGSCMQGVDTRLIMHEGICNGLFNTQIFDDQCELSAGGSPFASSASIEVNCGIKYYFEWDNRWSTSAFNFDFEFMPNVGNCFGTSNDFSIQSFESGLGVWRQVNCEDDLDWTIQTDSTTSINTGPDAAFVGDYYLYLEASSPNFPNKTAILESECFDLSFVNEPAFVMYAHMYGSTIGTLELQISTDEGLNWTPLETFQGEQGENWFSIIADLQIYKQDIIKLRISAQTGNGWTGDIAIDYLYFGELCPNIINYSSNQTYSFHAEANDNITSTSYVDANSVTYDAKNSIDLLPGFEVAADTEFEAYIDGCGFYAIELIGPALGGWTSSVIMEEFDSDNYQINNVYLNVGSLKFRANYSWADNWSTNSFPTGIGIQNGADITVTQAGYYNVLFNSYTGEYSFN